MRIGNAKITFDGSFAREFDIKRVKRIKINTAGGNDVVNFDVTGKFRPTAISGGSGNDTLSTLGIGTTLLGGSGDDTLVSGEGTGRLVTFNAVNLEDGSTVTRVASREYRAVTRQGGQLVLTPLTATFVLAQSATGNRLEGSDGNDIFETFGGEDTIVGGAGNDSFTAEQNGVDVYEETDLAPITLPEAPATTVRSRLASFGVENITTRRSGQGSVSILVSSLAELE